MSTGTLIICPLKKEWKLLEEALMAKGQTCQRESAQGRWWVTLPHWKAQLCVGGMGVSAMQEQTQYWIEFFNNIDRVISLGTAGSLTTDLVPGTLIAVTEITHPESPDSVLFTANKTSYFLYPGLVEGRILCASDAIQNSQCAQQWADQSGAVAVSMESLGALKAAQLQNIPYFEFRGLTDQANPQTEKDFSQNLPGVMDRLADLLIHWIKKNP